MNNMLNKELYNGLRAAGVSDENAQRIAAEAAKYSFYFNSLDSSITSIRWIAPLRGYILMLISPLGHSALR